MITKKVFNDLAVFMIGFGAAVGMIFPFFTFLTGVPADLVFTPLFFILCIIAGIVVGFVNIFIARKVIGSKLKLLADHMKKVELKLRNHSSDNAGDNCYDDKCLINIDSEDEIGESAKAFNILVTTLTKAFKSEKAVKNFTETLSSYLELEILAQESLSQLIVNLNAHGGAIFIESSGELRLLASSGINHPLKMLDSDLINKVIISQKRILVDFPEGIELNAILADFKPKSVIAEPIVYKNVMLGIVVLGGMHSFAEQNLLEDIDMFGRGLALAFRNAITHDQLQKLAANDALTGILNRRFGITRLRDEFARSVRNNIPMGLLIFDIDHFKQVNDIYGHLVGDKVLIKLTNVAKQALREGDVFLRYGGEEVFVVLPGTSSADVYNIAEKLRRIVEDSVIEHHEQQLKITISIGGLSFPEYQVNDFESMIRIADDKMYAAKNSGRNRVVV